MVEVRLVDVTKRFDKTIAVEAVSLTATSSQFVTLLGPSGCGKTTILRMIGGFERVDDGNILFDGESILSVPPEHRGVGMVFQRSALFPHMNVRQNVSYGLRYRKTRDSGSRVAEMLDLIGLRGLERRRPDQLSVGQQQRVALARALAPKPEILLLDEPLSALDAKLRDSLRFEIRQIQQTLSLTTIYVTHDQIEALAASDRIAVMSMGRIEQVGTPTDIYLRPQTLFAASFVGRTNRFEGVVTSVKTDDRGTGVSVETQNHHFIARIRGQSQPRPGEAVVLFVKIEDIALDDSRENRLPATAIGMEYEGENTVVQLQSSIGIHSARIPSQEGSSLCLREEVVASFAPEDTLLFLRDRDPV
ncbi:ABC transporter ATP-binding protein [Candidatus Bipolaricaulota bacterium]|nr:ABC transporter ATP-binding protein [Candidatus Bipolaricaulota bacterium]